MSTPSALGWIQSQRERAQYFNDWTPEGPKGEFCAKHYVLVEVELTAIGYLQKAEAGILLKYKPNTYR